MDHIFSFRQSNRDQNLAKGFKGSSKKDDVSGFRAVLLSGPPGVGKTTAALVIGKSLGFEVLELNASDARNKSSIDVRWETFAHYILFG
jgi:DNA polymerase III delta prime subunit